MYNCITRDGPLEKWWGRVGGFAAYILFLPSLVQTFFGRFMNCFFAFIFEEISFLVHFPCMNFFVSPRPPSPVPHPPSLFWCKKPLVGFSKMGLPVVTSIGSYNYATYYQCIKPPTTDAAISFTNCWSIFSEFFFLRGRLTTVKKCEDIVQHHGLHISTFEFSFYSYIIWQF